MPIYIINSSISVKSQERCHSCHKKSGKQLTQATARSPYYTYRDRHRKREFTFDKYEGNPEGGGIDAHKSRIDPSGTK